MGRVVYSMGVSLDGYIEGPNHELDWHIVDEELQSYVMTQQRRVGAYLWGRRVYDHIAAYWATADQDPAAPSFVLEYAGIWKNTPKIVFSRTLKHVDPRGNARLSGKSPPKRWRV
jgi:dihydrofolate reductase